MSRFYIQTKPFAGVVTTVHQCVAEGNSFRKISALLMSAGLLSVAIPQAAKAAEMDELKQTVQQLRVELNQIKDQSKSASNTTSQSPASSATYQFYGDADVYLNYMHSSAGHNLMALEDGGILRSRVGVKGNKPVDEGYAMKFTLEAGVNLLNGQSADMAAQSSNTTATSVAGAGTSNYGGRIFDRQAWAGIATPIGEFRAGRQNTTIFFNGGYIDFASRVIGSPVNNFGVPSRMDADLSYKSNRVNGFLFEGHYALPNAGLALSATQVAAVNYEHVYQLALDYENGPYRVGYMGIDGVAPAGAQYNSNAEYHNFYANYNYGSGKIYLVGIRTNNNGVFGNVGANATSTLVAGNNAKVDTNYNIYQISADYKVSPTLRIGGLYGKINDTTHSGLGGAGWAVGEFWDVFKDTQVYVMVDEQTNQANAGFKTSGSAGLPTNFPKADITGQSISGAQLGVVYKF